MNPILFTLILFTFMSIEPGRSFALEPDSLPAVPSNSSPYALPWQLRPVMTADVLRLDSAFASYNDKNGNSGGLAIASVITGSYKLASDLAVLARVGMVNNN